MFFRPNKCCFLTTKSIEKNKTLPALAEVVKHFVHSLISCTTGGINGCDIHCTLQTEMFVVRFGSFGLDY